MAFLKRYTGGNAGWGTMVSEYSECGEIVAEWECDENGIPTKCLFNNEKTHECPEEW